MINVLFSDSCRATCWGGVEKWVIMMAKQLNLNSYHAHLICRPDSLLEMAAKESKLTVHRARFRNSLDIRTIRTIYSIIKQEKIDLIICSTNLDIKLAGIAGKLASVPVISRQGLALIPNNLKYRFIIRNLTTSILTNTQTIKQQYESYHWFPKNHIRVIYNGVQSFQETPAQNLRKQLLSPPYEKLILSAGRLSRQKGFTYLIEAARIAQEQQKPWKFIILGEGQERKKLTGLIKQFRLKNIRLLGFQNNIYDFYANADLFVLSSLAEGTPNVVLEAMIAHCPVIATEVNGVKEVIEDNRNGWVVPMCNGEAIYQSIEQHIDNPQLLKQIADRAYQTVTDKFTIEKSSKEFIEYINNIVASHEKNHHKNA